jgi:hypothetical protein
MVTRPIYARCPGCGDKGDAEHIAACAEQKIRATFFDGAMWCLLIVEKQVKRRGEIDWSRLMSAIDYADRKAMLGRSELIKFLIRRR